MSHSLVHAASSRLCRYDPRQVIVENMAARVGRCVLFLLIFNIIVQVAISETYKTLHGYSSDFSDSGYGHNLRKRSVFAEDRNAAFAEETSDVVFERQKRDLILNKINITTKVSDF